MNNDEKVIYWLDLAKEDINVAQGLYSLGKLIYAGFMCHLSVEKALKAKIVSTGETPIKIHNLVRLAEIGSIFSLMTDEQTTLLITLNPLQIEARYPTYKQSVENTLTNEQCADMISQATEMVTWIEKQL
jgi:HEPN domain-containing protein